MLQASPYVGLPFVSRRRLVAFEARWRQGPEVFPPGGDDNPGFLVEDYFEHQRRSYHTLLTLAGEVSVDMDYWLDWSTPVHSRPRRLWALARRGQKFYLGILGRRQALESPSRTVQYLTSLRMDLCCLAAHIQATSFKLLTQEPKSLEEFQEVLLETSERLVSQVRATRHITNHTNCGLKRWSRSSNLGRPRSVSELVEM